MGAGAGAGREVAHRLWPLVLQMWEQHPLVLVIVLGVVALGAAIFLAWLWDIIRPPPVRPHEVYRPPRVHGADRLESTSPGDRQRR